MDEPVKPKMGRPPKPIDWKIFEQLCNIQCTHDEIASFLQVARKTLYEKAVREYGDEDFPTIYKRFSEGGKCSLRRNQFKLSATNAAMCIWLGKQWLGQVDKELVETKVPREELLKLEDKVAKLEYLLMQHAIKPETNFKLQRSDGTVQCVGRSNFIGEDSHINKEADRTTS